jgi:hypothetical protein
MAGDGDLDGLDEVLRTGQYPDDAILAALHLKKASQTLGVVDSTASGVDDLIILVANAMHLMIQTAVGEEMAGGRTVFAPPSTNGHADIMHHPQRGDPGGCHSVDGEMD